MIRRAAGIVANFLAPSWSAVNIHKGKDQSDTALRCYSIPGTEVSVPPFLYGRDYYVY